MCVSVLCSSTSIRISISRCVCTCHGRIVSCLRVPLLCFLYVSVVLWCTMLHACCSTCRTAVVCVLTVSYSVIRCCVVLNCRIITPEVNLVQPAMAPHAIYRRAGCSSSYSYCIHLCFCDKRRRPSTGHQHTATHIISLRHNSRCS